MSRRAARRSAVFIAVLVLPALALLGVRANHPAARPVRVVALAPAPPPDMQIQLVAYRAAADYIVLEIQDAVALAQAAQQEAARQEAVRAAAVAAKVRPRPSPPRQVTSPSQGGHNWDAVAACESGGNWAINTGNGFSGGLQFMLSTWRNNGGPTPYPWQATRQQQVVVAETILTRSSWHSQWPVCGRYL